MTHFLLKSSCIIFLFQVHMRINAQPATLKNVSSGGPGAVNFVYNHSIKLISGYEDIFLEYKDISVSFDYSEMKLCGSKPMSEVSSAARQMKKLHKLEKYALLWEKEKSERYEPAFTNRMDKGLEKLGFRVFKSEERRKLHLVLQIQILEPHEHSEQDNYLPYIYGFARFYTQDGLCMLSYELTTFGSRDNNDGDRTEECYEKTAKMICHQIIQYLKRQ